MPVVKETILPAPAPGVLLVLSALSFGGCASGTDTPIVLNVADKREAVTEQAREPMSADVMYRVMAAELKGMGGDVDQALSDYLEAALESDDPAIARRATILATRAGSPAHAAMAADRWQLLEPENLDASKALIAAHLGSGNYKAAARQLDDLFTRIPGSDIDKWQQVTVLLAQAGNDENARDLLREMIDRHQLYGSPEDVAKARVTQSRLAVKVGDMSLALRLAEEAAGTRKDSAETQLWAGRLMVANNRMDEATGYFKRAWQADPGNEDVAMAYAEILYRQKNILAANKVLADLPQTDRVLLNRIIFANLEQDSDRALGLYRQMENSIDSEDPGHALRVARAADILGLEKEAREWYARVPAEDESWLVSRLRLAVLTADAQGLEQGRAILEPLKNHRLAQVVEQAFLADAQLLQQAQKVDTAIEVLKRGLVRLPESGSLNYSLGLLYAGQRDVAAAERVLQKILRLDPENAAALNALGYTLADQTDRYTEAYEYIRRAYQLAPEDVAIIDSMGWVLYRLGRPSEAVVYLRQAWAEDKNPEIAAHLVEVLWNLSLKEEALEIYRQALVNGADDPVLQETAARLGL